MEQGADPDPGRLVIVGGSLDGDNAEVYRAVLDGREGSGPFCVLPTASGVPESSMERAVDRFQEYAGSDARVIGIRITTDDPEAANDPEVVDTIAGCSGFWFVGGAQHRILQVFRPATGDTPAYEALMARWADGAVVAGSSAGAAMMSSRSIGGGSPQEALASGVARDTDGDFEPEGEGVWVLPGMDFVPWAIVGQHHLARGRWGRLLVAVLEEEDRLGVGIDENTALLVEDGEARVIGASGVLLIDVGEAEPGTEPRTARGVRLVLMGPGDRLDVQTGEVRRQTAGKGTPAAPVPTPADRVLDDDAPYVAVPTLDEIRAAPFDRWALLHLMHYFAAGSTTRITLDGGARSLVLEAGEGFVGVADAEGGQVDEAGTPTGLSAGPLRLEVVATGG
jgi:cyanophycinase